MDRVDDECLIDWYFLVGDLWDFNDYCVYFFGKVLLLCLIEFLYIFVDF